MKENPYAPPSQENAANIYPHVEAGELYQADSLYRYIGAMFLFLGIGNLILDLGTFGMYDLFQFLFYTFFGLIFSRHVFKPALVIGDHYFIPNTLYSFKAIYFDQISDVSTVDGKSLSYINQKNKLNENVTVMMLKSATREKATQAIISAYQKYQEDKPEGDSKGNS